MMSPVLSSLGPSLWSLALLAADIAPADNLVVDGIPPIPDSIAEAARPYAEARSALLYDWHPGKREILIGTRFADTTQLHRVAFPGGARTQLTFFPDRVSGAAYPPDPRRADHFVFSRDSGGNEFFQGYRYELPAGRIALVTDGRSRNTLGVFSRDGARRAYTSTRRNGKDNDIYVQDPRSVRSGTSDAAGSDRLLAEVAGGGWQPLDFSPDGRQLLVLEYVSVNESYLWLFDTSSGARQPLIARSPGGAKVAYSGGRFRPDGRAIYTTTDKDSEFLRLAVVDLGSKSHRILTGAIPWDVDSFDVSADGRTLAVVTNEDGTGVLRLFDGRTGKERARPRLPPGTVVGVKFHPSGKELGLQLESARHPSDVFSLDLRTGKTVRWTESEVGGLDSGQLQEPELVKWKSFDQRTISGYLYRPAVRWSGKRPVIISIHGGPEAQFRPGYPLRWRYFLEELGVAVLMPNVRGSTGYGKSFTKLDNAELREDSVKDIGALIDWVKTRPDLDPDRIMITGGSYGGYMTLAASTMYADRIRCSLSVVGIANFISFLERTEAYRRDLRRVEYGDERDPKMREVFQKIGPLFNAKKITKPIFIVQGKNDPRVPAFEAEQIVSTLKQQSTPVWYLLAKDEGHGFAKKKNADFQLYATIAFVKKYLLP